MLLVKIALKLADHLLFLSVLIYARCGKLDDHKMPDGIRLLVDQVSRTGRLQKHRKK